MRLGEVLGLLGLLTGEAGNGLGVLVVDSLMLESISGAARCLSGARAAESGPVAAVRACQVLSVLLKRRARGPARLVWPGRGAGCGLSGAGECC